MTDLAIQWADIEAAATRLAGIAHRTPVLCSRTADARTGAKVFFKCENLQRMGAFKFRGAYNALARFSAAQRQAGVVAFSSGNHAQAVALSAQWLGMPSAIVMPQDAPPAKVAATRAYQAGGDPAVAARSEVILYDRYTEDREAIGRRLAAERGMTLVPPYDHADVMAGQGTAALELMQQVQAIDGGGLDALLVCVGGGGLISGCAVAAKAQAPAIQVWGVEPEAGNDVQQSLAAGRIVHIETPRTIADGAQTQHAGALTFPVIQRLVSGVVAVDDAALVDGMRFFAERMKLVVEPTGALGAAALFTQGQGQRAGAGGLPDLRGARVGVIVSGGNVDLQRYAALLGTGATG